jgi:UDP-N-acetylmuramate dehydrogenase
LNDVVLLRDEPLARHTALRVGGACDALLVVHREHALLEAIAVAAEWGTVTWLGHGTRLAVRDGGVSGVFVRLGTGFARIDRSHGEVWALLEATRGAGLSGVERLAGVPGSFGAALAAESDLEAVVTSVRFVHRGRIREGSLEDARKGRASRLILSATLALTPSTPVAVREAMSVARAARLPVGSFWEQPKGGRLRRRLARSGLGDVRIRKAIIPAVAPELIVNLGGASSSDIDLLARSARDRVKQHTGVVIEPRNRWLGQR